ncbi:hypothetical protein COV04_02545 [Candidatus Uhrbacteria bacterium CG10_big_fil_rev_8_21_14_0_10_48_11]|uniref:Glycosyltransferase 2-like domain-containing protein n=1 Tax=Candidatus Uhrbacteria bacterium CG10_big_fil_rev_8_21_14_0_10_48_11 TaxID=1975037 RepID=A0A2M8LEC9_9BACT|nr:MAG: hypothetical protein COV04_02545 [Candidatus Uhrbacteria bacterium CG10_big_fil_rev_8_21_14_0_10_48_11]
MISVIIPSYNHAKALKGCVESLAAQTRLPDEVLIIDDGSTDNTEEAVKQYLIDPRFKSLSCSYRRIAHSGAPKARNIGAQLAKGEYLIFLDADIIAKSTMLEKYLTALQSHPETFYVYASHRFGRKLIRSRPFDVAALRRQNYIHTSALIRRAAYCGFDESLVRFQDWDLWLTMAEQGHYGLFVDAVLFRARNVFLRRGISSWRPRLCYPLSAWLLRHFGWAPRWYRAYASARQRIIEKHQLPL